jgi:hypothetical protein
MEHFRKNSLETNLQPVICATCAEEPIYQQGTAHQLRVHVMSGMPPKGRGLQLLLHHLRTIVLGRIAHHLALVDWGLAVSIRIRGAVCRALPTAFHKDVSLFVQSVSVIMENVSNCWIRIGLTNLQRIFPGEALLAVSTWEWLHSQMDPLMSLQIVVTIEGLWTLVAFERSVILLLLLSRVMAVYWSAHLMRRILHVHPPHKCHLIPWAMHIRHDRAGHRRKRVTAIRWSRVVALWCCH